METVDAPAAAVAIHPLDVSVILDAEGGTAKRDSGGSGDEKGKSGGSVNGLLSNSSEHKYFETKMEKDDEAVARSTRRKLFWRISPCLCAGSCLYFMTRLQITLAADSMMQDLSINRSQFGYVLSFYSIPYSFLILPLSVLAARVGARGCLAAMLFGSAVVNMGTAAASSFAGLISARMVMGCIQAAWIPTLSYYNTIFFTEEMSKAISVSLQLGFTLSQVLPLGAGILYIFNDGPGSLQDWQYLLLLEGIPTLLLSPLLFVLLPSSIEAACGNYGKSKSIKDFVLPLLNKDEQAWLMKKSMQEKDDKDISCGENTKLKTKTKFSDLAIVKLLSDFRVVFTVLSAIGGFSGCMGAIYWSPAVISNEGAYSLGTSALLVIIPNAISIPVSIAYSALADRRKKPIVFSAFAQFIALIGLIMSTLVISFQKPGENVLWLTVLFIVTLTIVVSGWQCWYSTQAGWQASLFPDDLRAMGFSLGSLGTSIGTFIGPTVVGVLAEKYDFTVAFASLTGFSLGTLTLQIILSCTQPRKLLHLEAEMQEVPSDGTINKKDIEL